jgi:hypothetical protein
MTTYLFTCGVLLLAVLFATGAMLYFEGSVRGRAVDARGQDEIGAEDALREGEFGLQDAFWSSWCSTGIHDPRGCYPAAPRSV